VFSNRNKLIQVCNNLRVGLHFWVEYPFKTFKLITLLFVRNELQFHSFSACDWLFAMYVTPKLRIKARVDRKLMISISWYQTNPGWNDLVLSTRN